MEKSRLETKVGLFVLIGLLLLAVLMVWFNKGASLLHNTYLIKLHTANVGGLKPQSAVLLAGVSVGSVKQIQLDPSGTNVTVVLQIYEKFPIYHDARFVIEMSGFLGDQYVSVIPTVNLPPTLTNNDDVQCEAPFNLQEVARGAAGFVQRLDDTAKKLDASVSDLRARVLNAETLANFGTSITNLRDFTAQALDTIHDINDIVGTNTEHVDTVVSNIVLFSAQLNQLGNSASNILAANGANLTDATGNIRDLIEGVKAGRGLVGTLLIDNPTTTNVQMLAENLSLASSNLNRLGLWHVLWSHSPPGTNSVRAVTLQPRTIRQ